MDLICVERMVVADSCLAKRDHVIFSDMRVLNNLLDLEPVYMPPCNYFGTVQQDLQPFMRKVVATWMMEVCEEQRCENQVFPLAINFLDRFLCTTVISRQRFQLVGAVCLLIVSKIRQCHALNAETLAYYADGSFTAEDIRSCELLVLAKLKWNMTGVTGFDYVDHILERLSVCRGNETIRRHAHALVTICYCEPEYIQTPGSVLATAALISSVRGLNVPMAEEAVKEVLRLTRVDPADAEPIIVSLEASLAAAVHDTPQTTNKNPASAAATNSGKNLSTPSDESCKPETPTDVSEIYF